MKTTTTIMVLILVVVGALIFSSSFVAVASAQRIIEWKSFTDPKLGISLQYPSDWTVKQKANRFESGSDLVITTPNELGGNNLLGVIARNLPVNTSITGQLAAEVFKDAATDEATSKGIGIHIVEDITKHYPIDGQEAFSFILARGLTSRPSSSIQVVEEGITVLLQKQKLFGFAFTALSTHYDDPDQVQIRDHILKSIKFLEVPQR